MFFHFTEIVFFSHVLSLQSFKTVDAHVYAMQMVKDLFALKLKQPDVIQFIT
jgi:hypothetical protein